MDLMTAVVHPPIVNDSSGIVRVAGTRITLDTIVRAFKNGSTCEEIVYLYSVLRLADVYNIITHYLNNHDNVESYLSERQNKAIALQAEIEKHVDVSSIRERLLNRRKVQKSNQISG
ncbi:DUF433 domain-containing protein [candidate division KSB1 bacterium]|nr:DUF433 domain-containing protein [candidate division KSB1 bacterium]